MIEEYADTSWESRPCIECGVIHPKSGFKHQKRNGKLHCNTRTCMDCESTHSRARNSLMRATNEDGTLMFPKPEDGCCERCGSHSTKLHLDHNHNTLEFRGWLCNTCNTKHLAGKELETEMEKTKQYLEFSKNRLKNNKLNKNSKLKVMSKVSKKEDTLYLLKFLIDSDASDYAVKALKNIGLPSEPKSKSSSTSNSNWSEVIERRDKFIEETNATKLDSKPSDSMLLQNHLLNVSDTKCKMFSKNQYLKNTMFSGYIGSVTKLTKMYTNCVSYVKTGKGISIYVTSPENVNEPNTSNA